MTFHVAVDWELDLEDPSNEAYLAALKEYNLPLVCTIDCEDEDDIADALSDLYGWLVYSYKILDTP